MANEINIKEKVAQLYSEGKTLENEINQKISEFKQKWNGATIITKIKEEQVELFIAADIDEFRKSLSVANTINI
jgi:hypothetical protein